MTDIEYEKELWNKSGIYCWTSPSGKRYIGLSRTLGSRHKDFRCASKNRTYTGTHSYLDSAREKYPYKEWKYEVLEYCEEELLGEREQYWINYYNTTNPKNGYNITIGGIGGNGVPKSAFKKGHKMTEEQREKARLTKQKHIEEGSISYADRSKKVALYNDDGSLFKVFDKVCDCWELLGIRGSGISKWHIKKKYRMIEIEGNAPLFIEPYKKEKRTRSKEAIEKMRNAHLGKKQPSKWKPVIALNDDGTLFKRFDSVNDAADFIVELEFVRTGVKPNQKTCAKAITQVINKKGGYDKNGKYHVRKKSHGFRWEHAS